MFPSFFFHSCAEVPKPLSGVRAVGGFDETFNPVFFLMPTGAVERCCDTDLPWVFFAYAQIR